MKILKLKSPGKVNYRLDVFKKRPDGYHEIRMLNSKVALFDDIDIEIIERGIDVECENDPFVPSGPDNIAYKACKEIMAYSNKNVGVSIRIQKHVPSGSGMGGGASNAATVLMGVNQLLKINLPKEKLFEIGLRFGADIPFFLYGYPAIATGIGENLTKIKKMPKMPMVIVSPNVVVSTKSIYDRYQPNGNHSSGEEIPLHFATKKTIVRYLNNDLEQVTARQIPVVTEVRERLVKLGAMAAQMTGSGPTVFAIFADKLKAQKACKKMEAASCGQWRTFLTENV